MPYSKIFKEAIHDTWTLVFGGLANIILAALIAGALILFALFWKGRESAKEKAHDAFLGMGASIAVAIILFVAHLFVITPTRLLSESKKTETTRSNEVHSLTVVTQTLHHQIEDLSQPKTSADSGSNTIASMRTMWAETLQMSVEAITSSLPAVSMLTGIATIPTNTVITDRPISPQTLKEEQENILAEKKISEARKQATEATRKFYVSRSNALAYAFFRSSVELFMRKFTNELSVLAAQVGDKVTSNYSGLPDLLTTNILLDYASLRLGSNSMWNFSLSLYADGPVQFIAIIKAIATNASPPVVTISYDKFTEDPQWRKTPFVFYVENTDPGEPPQRSSVDEVPVGIGQLLRSFLRTQQYRFPLTNSVSRK
jgi:hypothetical protein